MHVVVVFHKPQEQPAHKSCQETRSKDDDLHGGDKAVRSGETSGTKVFFAALWQIMRPALQQDPRHCNAIRRSKKQ